MELREIRVFLTAAEELHFGRAADRLALTPSRVSQIVARVETRLGTQLFERTSRRVVLTAAGRRLLERVGPAYEELRVALEETVGDGIAQQGTLLIGSYLRVASGSHMAGIMDRFAAENPGWSAAYVDTGLRRNYLDALRAGEADIVAARLPLSDPAFTVGPVLTRETRVLVVGRTHRLAERRTVTWEDLGGETVNATPAFPTETLDAFLPPQTPSGRPVLREDNRSYDELLHKIRAGRLVRPTVPSFFEYFADPGFVAIPITDMPPSETALVWLADDQRPIIRAFVAATEAVIRACGGIQLRTA